jgi:hypothetical protein
MTTTIVLVRRDMSPSQQLVQACHAVQCLRGERITRMVILNVNDEKHLQEATEQIVKEYAYRRDVVFENQMYYEAPISEYTASAIVVPEGLWLSRVTRNYDLALRGV